MEDNLMDFFDPNKKFNRVILKTPDFGSYRRTDYDIPPPETNESLYCPEPQWQAFIEEEGRKLSQACDDPADGYSEVGTVVRSDMDGIEGRSTVTKTVAQSHGDPEDGNLIDKFDFDYRGAPGLPIEDSKETILDMINSHQIVIISGPTGCGKSTQVPQYILDHHAMERKMVNIIVTQPRKIAASSVARRVCEERGWTVGGLVGYQVGLDRAHKSADTRLLYVTTGVLKRIIIGKKSLSNYTHIILDEVHDREEDMDLVLLICKKLLYTNSRSTKLVLMSATLNEEKLSNYYATHLGGVGTIPAPVLPVGCKSDNHYNTYYTDDLISYIRKMGIEDSDIECDIGQPLIKEKMLCLCKSILNNLDLYEEKRAMKAEDGTVVPGAVLVFLPGINEITLLRDYLMEQDEFSSKKVTWCPLPLHSSVSWEEQQLIYGKVKPHHRKIILSTNIAESSLTVPDIKYVIDFCLTKNMQTDRDTNYPRLMLDWACQNQLTQRAGRAGRVNKDGKVFRLIPKDFLEHLPKENTPEMLRVPLTNVILDIKLLDLGSPKQLLALAMDPPEMQSLQKAVMTLKEVGALLPTVRGVHVRDDGDLTVLGEIVAKLPLDVKLGKLIVLGHMFGLLDEAIIIAAGLNGKTIFTTPFDKRVQSYKTKLFWADRTFSDCFAVLLAYQTWISRRNKGEFSSKQGSNLGQLKEEQFCKSSFIQRRTLEEMRKLIEDIKKSLKLMNIEPLQIQHPVEWENDSKLLVLKLIMFGAFYPNYFNKQVSREIEINANRVLLGKDPTTTIYLQGMEEKHAPYGDIYYGQIKELFKECCKEEENIEVTFDGRKIFVEFQRNAAGSDRMVEEDLSKNLTGDIIHQVYVAIKLRNLGPQHRRLRINLYGSVEMAEAKHEEWKKAVEIAKKKQLESTHIEQIPPPGKDVSHLNIERITHVSSPSMFWVQTTEVSHNVERLHTIIEHSLRNCPQVGSIYDVKVGNMFLAPFKDPSEKEIHFYRARVNAIMEKEKVVVFFIDYGNVEIVDYRNLRVMSAGVVQEFSELVTIPGLAHECCLASVQPDRLRSSKGLWDDEVIKKFKNLLLGHVGGNIVSRIFSVTRSGSGHNKYVTALETIEVKLADNSTVDVRRQLLEDKLMDQAVESFLSQDDHRERLRFAAYGSAMQEHVKNPYSSASLLPKVDVHFQQERRLQPLSVPLQGPFSPLEHKVHCAYRGGGIKAVNIDQESVNAVMLDASPSNPHDQWMVAAHVAMSPSSESLQIRNTTWLPSKPGFGAMATMMFAPQVELRVNKAKTKLTGFVAGLGPKMIWDKPMDRVSRSERTHSSYPEHDIEVKFDVNITNSDIDKINKMRYWMNQMMMKTEDGIMHISQPKSLDAAQKGLQRNLLLLLEEARHHEEKVGVPCGHEYRWNMLENKLRLKSKADQVNFFYRMIDGVRIEEKNKASEAVLEKLIELYQKMDVIDTNPLAYHEVCPVCPGQLMMTTPRDIHQHLHSDQHKYEENIIVDSSDTVASSSCADSVR